MYVWSQIEKPSRFVLADFFVLVSTFLKSAFVDNLPPRIMSGAEKKWWNEKNCVSLQKIICSELTAKQCGYEYGR